jgi:2-isopropylmalate synthase
VQPNKAIVGANAFAHESGIHQDGVLKHRETYEIMRAEDVGWTQNKLVLGKHLRPQRLPTRLAGPGHRDRQRGAAQPRLRRFKELADKKHEIFDEDLQALMSDEAVTPEQEHYKLVSLRVLGDRRDAACPLDAVDRRRGKPGRGGRRRPGGCLVQGRSSACRQPAELLLYSVNSITGGTDAQGEVTVRLAKDGRVVNGQGADTDIIVASAKAYINALNKLVSKPEKVNPQVPASARQPSPGCLVRLPTRRFLKFRRRRMAA